jgi:RNA polymerase sigma-54 factor
MPQLRQTQSLKQTLSPQQVLQANLLQLTVNHLEQKILDEVGKNPLLEPLEPKTEELAEGEPEPQKELDYEEDPDEYEPANIYNTERSRVDIPIPDHLDFIEGLVQQLDMYDLNEWERAIAEEILWNLDEQGYLEVDLALIADRFTRTEEEVERVLKKVQQLDPPGIAARNLKECLLIQLQDRKESLAYRVIQEAFDDFANHRFEAVQKKLGVTKEELAQAVEEITHLNPRPGAGKISAQTDTVIPDLLAVQRENEWVVIVNDSWLPELNISNQYVALMNQVDLPRDTRKYLKEKYDSATWFIQAIEQRRKTLSEVMYAIIRRQPKFFEGNTQALEPMRLQDIADDIGMDISTVSRSTRGKYVDTPFGIFELKSFFTGGYVLNSGEEVSTQKIKTLLKEVIDSEDKFKPLTDTQLAEVLKQKGYPVARRTVAKYREQLNYPVARLRRQLT